jgi:hypothetical protein
MNFFPDAGLTCTYLLANAMALLSGVRKGMPGFRDLMRHAGHWWDAGAHFPGMDRVRDEWALNK